MVSELPAGFPRLSPEAAILAVRRRRALLHARRAATTGLDAILITPGGHERLVTLPCDIDSMVLS